MTSAFDRIRTECLKSGDLFEDPDFQCIPTSVFYDESPPFNFTWKRPHEITPDPKFVALASCSGRGGGGATAASGGLPFDSIVGKLGDPWFVSAISLLYQCKGLFYRVVPADQSFDSSEYAGIFRFRIWWFGQWQEVVIDDRLPINPVTNRLVFIQPLFGCVYWPALLEKAFAKLHGSYEALKYGTSAELLADLTGGATEVFDLTSDPLCSRSLIQQLISISSIVTAVISGESQDEEEARVVAGHSTYSNDTSDVDDLGQKSLLFNYSNHHKQLHTPSSSSRLQKYNINNINQQHHHNNNNNNNNNLHNNNNNHIHSNIHRNNNRNITTALGLAGHHDYSQTQQHQHHQQQQQQQSCESSKLSGPSGSFFYPSPVKQTPNGKLVNNNSNNGICSINNSNKNNKHRKSSSSSSSSASSASSPGAGFSSHSSSNGSDERHLSSMSQSFHRLPCGLIAGINYRITAVERVEVVSDGTGGGVKEPVYLVRLVNPMANLSTYTGAFGIRGDRRWSFITTKDRMKLDSMDEEQEDETDDIFDDFWQPSRTSGTSVNRFNQSSVRHASASTASAASALGGVGGGSGAALPSTSSSSTSGDGSRAGRGGLKSSSSFWMDWCDFVKLFTHLEIVYLDGETSRDEPSLRGKFPMTVKLFRGIWRKGITAGGCRNNQDTFHLNPQIELTIGPDCEDMLVICLNQHSVLEPQVVGFSVYRGPGHDILSPGGSSSLSLACRSGSMTATSCSSSSCNSSCNKSAAGGSSGSGSGTYYGRMDRAFFKKNKSLINSSYSNSRQVLLRTGLNRGSYILLPTSFEAGHEGIFSVRIYSMKGTRLRILDSPNCMSKNPILKSPASFDVKFTQYELMFMHLADEHSTVNAFELQDLLVSSLPNDYVKSCATLEVSRMIITAMDASGFGRIHIKDYKNIMCSLRYWQNIFKNHTKGTAGILRVEKLEDALADVGFGLSSEVASRVILKYMRKDSTLRFGDFVSAILQLTIAFTSYDKHTRNSSVKQVFPSSTATAADDTCFSLSLTDWLKVSLQT